MKTVFAGLAALALSACSTVPRTVEVPVPVPCHVTLPMAPEWATDKLTGASSRFERVRALLVEREQARGHITELRAAAAGCQ